VDEFGAGHLDERGIGLARDRFCQHRLAGPWWTVEQDARGGFDTHLIEGIGASERQFDRLAYFAHLLF